MNSALLVYLEGDLEQLFVGNILAVGEDEPERQSQPRAQTEQ
jgi:hypothetical protein